MFVHPDHRKKGFASAILKELEIWAKEIGYAYTILETGKNQPEAINLYQKSRIYYNSKLSALRKNG